VTSTHGSQARIFIVPDGTKPDSTVQQITAADRSGLDIVGVQDHPYQWRFFDTWTLLAYAAGVTHRVRFIPDVLNLPLRLPALIAKSVASLDVLSGGRVELGLGAGAFWDAVEAMGGPRRTPKESVDALEEAVKIVRSFWSGQRSIRFDGHHHQVRGAHPGPPPAHPVGIWLRRLGEDVAPRLRELLR
jgi:alkanesulfonate monooxygenase SsuD/methylene tetrahydromethanopterin reductase-like flavin-dependent oxidoreductase (luciferase family)